MDVAGGGVAVIRARIVRLVRVYGTCLFGIGRESTNQDPGEDPKPVI